MDEYVLITGGTKGIGKALAKSLSQKGYNLILTYGTDSTAAQLTRDELRAACDVDIIVLQADSADKKAIDIILNAIETRHIRLKTVILNAGVTCRDRFEALTLDDWERVFFANVHFPTFLLQRLLDHIPKGGSVIFTGSLMALHPHGLSLPYGVTKAAVHALVKNLVKYLTPYDIRVNAVAPGFIDTDWQKTKSEDLRRQIEGKIALGRFCDPDELTGVYQLLIDNSYINGEVIVVDGGYAYK